MSLRFALLGFLTTEPASGYRLAREFGDSMGWFWYASHSQIHPELRRLEQEGLVQSERYDRDARGKVMYSITQAGVEELNRWLGEETDYPPVRDVERIRLVFLDQQPLEVIRRHLESHRKHHEGLSAIYTQQLREVRQGSFPRLQKRLATQPAHTHDLVVGLKVLALHGNLERARTEISWAEDALIWLEGLGASTGGDAHD